MQDNSTPVDKKSGPAAVVRNLRKVLGVYILATGGSGQQDQIIRRDSTTAEKAALMVPRVVKDYQTFMGGVGVHDQLRLQRQMSGGRETLMKAESAANAHVRYVPCSRAPVTHEEVR
ncbi:unnamed protein product [Phytophthora fragariaefolia]|uniref:Unnamed protein product n=1 Tax=Phytophthora fragariaefolia TaxID=1490495 RepID=A0A9W6TNJ7_9STRA|nr:unnamed protein product [Phytophthora fragariaefolia]